MEYKFNKTTILLMVISLVAGFFLNYYSTKIANDKLLQELKAELDLINKAQQTTRGASSSFLERRKGEVEAEIRVLSKK